MKKPMKQQKLNKTNAQEELSENELTRAMKKDEKVE